MQILIRHSRNHSVIAHYQPDVGGIRLIRLSPDAGPMPDIGHIAGALFPDVAALRRAVLAAMRGPTGDTLDNVFLSQSVYAEWTRIATEAGQRARAAGIRAEDIPDERAREISGKRLLIYVDVPDPVGTVQLVVAPEQWAWRNRPQ